MLTGHCAFVSSSLAMWVNPINLFSFFFGIYLRFKKGAWNQSFLENYDVNELHDEYICWNWWYLAKKSNFPNSSACVVLNEMEFMQKCPVEIYCHCWSKFQRMNQFLNLHWQWTVNTVVATTNELKEYSETVAGKELKDHCYGSM